MSEATPTVGSTPRSCTSGSRVELAVAQVDTRLSLVDQVRVFLILGEERIPGGWPEGDSPWLTRPDARSRRSPVRCVPSASTRGWRVGGSCRGWRGAWRGAEGVRSDRDADAGALPEAGGQALLPG
jgi:hypothetical protein